MMPRHPARVPTRWLMTDERIGAALWPALRRLPRGAGVVVRHHSLARAARRVLLRRIAVVARARGLVLIRAGAAPVAGERGTHKRAGRGLVTWPAHDRAEAVAAVRRGARVLFVSPVFGTRSHADAPALGPRAAAAIVRGLPVLAVALGGMDERRFRALAGFHGWAGIDAWAGQKRNAVPT